MLRLLSCAYMAHIVNEFAEYCKCDMSSQFVRPLSPHYVLSAFDSDNKESIKKTEGRDGYQGECKVSAGCAN